MFIYCLDFCCNISSHGGINFFDHIAEAAKIHIFQCMGHYLICMIRMNRSGLCINDNRSACTIGFPQNSTSVGKPLLRSWTPVSLAPVKSSAMIRYLSSNHFTAFLIVHF